MSVYNDLVHEDEVTLERELAKTQLQYEDSIAASLSEMDYIIGVAAAEHTERLRLADIRRSEAIERAQTAAEGRKQTMFIRAARRLSEQQAEWLRLMHTEVSAGEYPK